MDMLPIRPSGGEYIKPATSTANDGGSKSQSGYIPRGERKEKKDEIIVSDETKRLLGEDPVIEEENSLFDSIKEFFASLIKAVSKLFSFQPKDTKQDLPLDLFAEKK